MKPSGRFRLEISLAGALMAMAAFAAFVGPTALEERAAREIGLTFRERLAQKRSWFFGHSEMADTLASLSVVATVVDLWALPPGPEVHSSKPWLRFETSLHDLRFLSRFAIGMNELYVFPASYLLFQDENPALALEVVDLGLADERTGPQLPLLAGFLSHVFFRDPERASRYYEILYKKHKAPSWVNELALKLRSGADPVDADTPARRYVENLVRNAFPRAREFFERHQKLREGRLQETAPVAPLPAPTASLP